MVMATVNLPFPMLKSTGDDKHDIEVYIKDLMDYCVMNNWYDSSKEIDAEKWTKPDKVMACLRASLTKSARTVLKYSLGLTVSSKTALCNSSIETLLRSKHWRVW